MGFGITFNWALQIEVSPDDLKENMIYDFVKSGNRVFPLETPIDLINLQREAVAKVSIMEFANDRSGTRGKYKVIKKYTHEEKLMLTNYWIENE